MLLLLLLLELSTITSSTSWSITSKSAGCIMLLSIALLHAIDALCELNSSQHLLKNSILTVLLSFILPSSSTSIESTSGTIRRIIIGWRCSRKPSSTSRGSRRHLRVREESCALRTSRTRSR